MPLCVCPCAQTTFSAGPTPCINRLTYLRFRIVVEDVDLVTMWFIELPAGQTIWQYASLYSVFMKMMFLMTSYAIIYLMRYPMARTYDNENDTFRIIVLVEVCLILRLSLKTGCRMH